MPSTWGYGDSVAAMSTWGLASTGFPAAGTNGPATWGYAGLINTTATWGYATGEATEEEVLYSGEQWKCWMLEGEYWLNPTSVAWATFGLWCEGEEGELGPPVRPRILRFFAKRPVVQLYVRLKKKESVVDE